MDNTNTTEADKSKKNWLHRTFDKHPEGSFAFAICLALFSTHFALRVGPSHPKFIPELVKVFFNYIAFQGAILFTVKNILFFYDKRTFLYELFLSILIAGFTFILIVPHNEIFNNLVYIFYPTPLTTAILDKAVAIPWAFVVVGINLVVSVLLYMMQNRKVKGLDKIIHNGLLAYGFLSIAVWFFAHFSYVGSNFIYMSTNLKIIDSVVEKHLVNKQPLPPGIQLQVYDNLEQLQSGLYQDTKIKFHEQELESKGDHSTELYSLEKWLSNVKEKNYGDYQHQDFTKDDVHDFTDWVYFVLNFPRYQVYPDKWMASDLVFQPKRIANQSLIKHGLFYVKRFDGKYYVFCDFDKRFKEKKENLIFNEFYVFFHFIYWIFFIWLIRHHRRKVFRKEHTHGVLL